MSAHVVYRLRNQAGDLLYIGFSRNLQARLSQHHGRDWWPEVASVDVEHHPTRLSALAAERAAIRSEAPLYNQIGARPIERGRGPNRRRETPVMTPLRAAVKSDGRRQYEIAKAVGIDPTQLSYYVSGLVPSPEVKLRLAEVLGRPVIELWPEPVAA